MRLSRRVRQRYLEVSDALIRLCLAIEDDLGVAILAQVTSLGAEQRTVLAFLSFVETLAAARYASEGRVFS